MPACFTASDVKSDIFLLRVNENTQTKNIMFILAENLFHASPQSV